MKVAIGLAAFGTTALALAALGFVGSSGASTPPTIRQTVVSVNGRSERVIVDRAGLPLYTYGPDTSHQSFVTGSLATTWPPLTGTVPSEAGLPGKVALVHTQNGRQVTYNGHFLYTFVGDSPGSVQGDGVQNFYVATPALSVLARGTHVSPPSSTNNYGYG